MAKPDSKPGPHRKPGTARAAQSKAPTSKSAQPGDPIRPGRDIPSRAAVLRCPIENAEMEKLDVHGVIVDRCTVCSAIWFDVPELSQILDIKGAAAEIDKPLKGHAPRAASTILLCPRDHTEMKVRTDPVQKHISMHRCPMCLGILLKGGDLRDLSEFTLKERIASFFG